jgi:23S rRNA (guanosine2251-2'-O)-methyltransferase
MRKLKNEELGRLTIEEYKQSNKTPIAIILDNIRSLNNIGSVFRTGDGLCIEQIYLCGITATPPNKDIHKTALGATESVTWKYKKDTLDAIKQLKSEGYTIVSVEQAEGSIMLQNFKVKVEEKYALVFGHEVKGVAQNVVDASDYCLEIPQFGTKHSFNISVSAGMVMWELFRQMR